MIKTSSAYFTISKARAVTRGYARVFAVGRAPVSSNATSPAYTVCMTASARPDSRGFEPFAPGVTPSGMVVLRASRLEAMVPELLRLMAALPPDGVLEPHRVIAAHPGMRQWLLGALAHAAGPRGIVANVDVELASGWIDSEAKRLLGRQAIQLPKYQPAHLRWRILEILEEPARARMSDARLARYLAPVAADQAAELAVRKFQLADRLARIFSQYMVYRPEWLNAWQAGDFLHASRRATVTWQQTERDLLAPLWQTLRRDAGPHRGEVIAELINALSTDAAAPSHPLHVFGVSHLAPNELRALKAAALHRVVVFHVPDPCREYWAGLRQTSLPALQETLETERAATAAAGPDDFWHGQMHPMLAQWGRLGRDFLLQLAQGNDRILTDVRDKHDESDRAPRSRLERVQESIRQDALNVLEFAGESTDDFSLRVHVCHTRVRELEAVRDAILDAIDREKGSAHPLLPSDIAVVAPDIGLYAPLIPGVFGAEAERSVWPPYAISDNSTRAAHPLFAAFAAFLAMPGSRITANQIINLVAQPAIARAYNLDRADVLHIGEWLADARAAWGLDAAHRTSFGVPEESAQNSLLWAMDRLMAGYVFGRDSTNDAHTVFELPNGTLAPAGDIRGPAADALGGLHALLDNLRGFEALAQSTDTGANWAEKLAAVVQANLRIDPNDADEKKAMTQLHQMLRSLEVEADAADASPQLHFEVVRTVLTAGLEAAPAGGRFLRGGITFAGMVPQRSVPFRFIAVLGLNEGEFPRHSRDAGLDLMSQVRALGDRDVRNDDRWLFLETLMSARDQLHLSYLGRSASKGEPLNPASPLAELDALMLQAWRKSRVPDTVEESDAEVPPWRVDHALQPFAMRYFNASDPRFFSFNETFAGISGTPEAARIAPLVTAACVSKSTPDSAGPLALQSLLAYYKDPAKFIFRTHLNAQLDGLSQELLTEHEPLDAAFARYDTVGRRVFFHDVLSARAVPVNAPTWLQAEGLLPVGDAGVRAWTALHAVLSTAWAQVAPHLTASMKPCAVEIDLAFDDGNTLRGALRNAWRDEAGHWVLLQYKDSGGESLPKAANFDFKLKVPLFVEWAALRLTLPDDQDIRCLLPHESGKEPSIVDRIAAWQAEFSTADAATRTAMKASLRQRLGVLIRWAQNACNAPLAYFPKTSSRAVTHAEVTGVWRGNERQTGESGYSVYARLLGRGHEFDRDTEAYQVLSKRALDLHKLIELEPL